ncbi:response regulator [Inquilinus limosus]|uniref:response regulator n=1 Tax=Inquilinus limosus TaxID=171674 RepID=UPI003F15DF97
MSETAGLTLGEGAHHDPAGIMALRKHTSAMKILLVDDDELFLDFAATMLRADGATVDTCASAAEAIAALNLDDESKPARDFDAVLIDIVMPEVSGTELCSLIRGHAGYGDLPVIMISATRDMSLIGQALTAGGSSYIQKPIQAATFAEEIRQKIAEARG